ncbi:DnaD domain protein [Radiobacillus kanasensis]|uniref:replication initiation and membrane attachment family protein n=1 Tax=Radiobacillus kanasensis TaxID=2844358 RepID=UPI001E3E2BA5|nr:DnaD domain protein [Radiobacillus kanasensis]UFT97996.1 DnaD domain protein [Radiobacillus kanasensis]
MRIGKILPVETYTVTGQASISAEQLQALTHLYQPLIGLDAVGLYLTLLNELSITGNDDNSTHHVLMTYLDMPLDQIYEARLKLEAIGLLRTWKKGSSNDLTSYRYQLQLPFTPRHFLADGVLSQLLMHEIGEAKYEKLETTFERKYPINSHEGEDITADFFDVFHTRGKLKADVEFVPSPPNQQVGPNIVHAGMDTNWFEHMLKQRKLPVQEILTPANKKLIEQMLVLYDLPTTDVENALLWAVTDENRLDQKEFKSACHDIFQSKQTSKVSFVPNQEPEKKVEQQPTPKPSSKQDQFIHMLEEISPKQLLEDLSGGNEASAQDLKIIRDVMSQQGLSVGVMNVLVHYVLLKTDMKLSKAYLEKIASHWARKNVKTAKQAMVLAKSENNKYQQWGTSSQQRKSTKQEVLPEWFKQSKEPSSKPNKNQPAQETEKKEDIAALLQNYSKNKKTNQMANPRE